MSNDLSRNPPHYNDLRETTLAAQTMLKSSPTRGSALRNAVVAAHNPAGFPSTRIMIVRDFEHSARSMTFFTDVRIPKISQIRNDARVSLLFYDPEEKNQMRIEGHAQTVAGGEPTRIAWDALPVPARRDYMADQAPAFVSSIPTSGLPEEFDHTNVDLASTEHAYENFAIMAVKFVTLDWLFLADSGNRRARHEWSKDETPFRKPCRSAWLVP